jgi:hypothetical protein
MNHTIGDGHRAIGCKGHPLVAQGVKQDHLFLTTERWTPVLKVDKLGIGFAGLFHCHVSITMNIRYQPSLS